MTRLQEIKKRWQFEIEAMRGQDFSKTDDLEWLINRVERLEAALRKAMDLIESEYCSHSRGEENMCGAMAKGCYTREFYQLLEEPQ